MDEKIRRKNMFLTDKIARKAFCVGGLFYPIRFFSKVLRRSDFCKKSNPLKYFFQGRASYNFFRNLAS